MPDEHPSPWSGAPPQDTGWAPAPSYAPGPPAPLPQPPYAPQLPPYAPPYAVPAPVPIEVRLSSPPNGGRGLQVAGLVLGGLALLVALLTAGFVGFAAFGGGPGGGPYGLRGTVAPERGALTGAALAEEVSAKVADDGGEPEDVVCPETPKVAQDVTTVCHGTDYGDEVTFVVFFEDDRGTFTLLEV